MRSAIRPSGAKRSPADSATSDSAPHTAPTALPCGSSINVDKLTIDSRHHKHYDIVTPRLVAEATETQQLPPGHCNMLQGWQRHCSCAAAAVAFEHTYLAAAFHQLLPVCRCTQLQQLLLLLTSHSAAGCACWHGQHQQSRCGAMHCQEMRKRPQARLVHLQEKCMSTAEWPGGQPQLQPSTSLLKHTSKQVATGRTAEHHGPCQALFRLTRPTVVGRWSGFNDFLAVQQAPARVKIKEKQRPARSSSPHLTPA